MCLRFVIPSSPSRTIRKVCSIGSAADQCWNFASCVTKQVSGGHLSILLLFLLSSISSWLLASMQLRHCVTMPGILSSSWISVSIGEFKQLAICNSRGAKDQQVLLKGKKSFLNFVYLTTIFHPSNFLPQKVCINPLYCTIVDSAILQSSWMITV